MESLGFQSPTDEMLGAMREVRLEWNLEMDREELYWEQRARANWMRFEDRNLTFFHRFVSQRKKRNTIKKIVDVSGNIVEDVGDISRVAIEYFQALFTLQVMSHVEDILEGVNRCITGEMDERLGRRFTVEDIYAAFCSMSHFKASGEDRLGAIFF